MIITKNIYKPKDFKNFPPVFKNKGSVSDCQHEMIFVYKIEDNTYYKCQKCDFKVNAELSPK